jgi:hypothetical protein
VTNVEMLRISPLHCGRKKGETRKRGNQGLNLT